MFAVIIGPRSYGRALRAAVFSAFQVARRRAAVVTRTPARQYAQSASGACWDRRKPPANGARQIARYSRQAAAGQITRSNGLAA